MKSKKDAMTNLESITLIPYAGLCNRMRAISSAIYVSIHHNVPLKIIWNKSYNCAAHFTDLFYPIEEFYKLKYCSTVVYMVPRA